MMITTYRASILLACLAAACTANPPTAARPTAEAAPAPAAPPTAPAAPPAPATATPAPAAPPAPATPSEPATPPVAAAEPTPPTDPALPSLADPDPDAPAADPALDPSAAPAPTAPIALVAAPIVAAEHTANWRDVVTLSAGTVAGGFQYFATGVLAGEAPNFFTLDAGGAWGPVAVPAPPGKPSGHWPDETWAVETGHTRDRAAIPRLRLHRLRGQSRWVPQSLGADQWVETDHLGPLRKSWNVGFLAVLDGSLVRVAGNGTPDPALPVVRGSISDFVESKAGDLYVLSNDGAYHVQIACADEACVQTNSIPLPQGGWEWQQSIPRQKHSVSIGLHDATNNLTNHLLHYETGGWKLEVLPAGGRLVALWPTADGGMWAQTETGLLHRDPAGAWRSVALPADLRPSGPVFAAMTGNMSELVVVGVRDGAQVVLATAAKTQAAG
ncbi:hypothetical protein [Nannocystis punicea]|uniref:Uncharacterized protein n=1 Tax=Nannocystis punicea TaxID=2995304 RepID=A0ABY7GSH2_9BACT|nr:hypothetical protein [Nannocystis poenicansa]WAS89873.1 hypothetical protein O0S08_27080 [Nannocystis poenicansa]